MTAASLCSVLSLSSPILLGPFGGMSSVALTAAVSNAGGLGGFGFYGYDAARITETMARLREATSAPVAANIWLPGDDGSGVDFDAAAQALAPEFAALGVSLPERPARYLPPLDEQLGALWDAAPEVLSVVFGVPTPAMVAECQRRGIRLIGTATSVAEAVALEQSGVDAVVASGAEAAGHRVAFLRDPADSIVGTMALVPQVVDAVSVPVIAAGGIADRRGVAAAFALGASGVQVGTAFLVTAESAANNAHRAAIRSTSADDTVLTRAMSGRLARGARNRAVADIEQRGAIAPFPVQNWLTGQFRAVATERGLGDYQSLWMGQAAPLAVRETASAVFDELAAGVPD